MRIITVTIFIFALILAGLPGGLCGVARAAQDPEARFGDALVLYRAGSYGEAADRAVVLANESTGTLWEGRSLFLAGRAFGEAGMPDLASGYLELSRSKYPILADHSLYLQAGYLYDAGRYDEAAKLYLRVADEYPKSVLATGGLLYGGKALVDAGGFVGAAAALNRLLEKGPVRDTAAEAHYLLMAASVGTGDYVGAISHYRTLWLDYPGSSGAKKAEGLVSKISDGGYFVPEPGIEEYVHRAGTQEGLGMYTSAAGDYATALTVMPQGHPLAGKATVGLGHSFYMQRRNTDAIDVLNAAVPGQGYTDTAPEALYWLAKSYLRTGQPDLFRAVASRCVLEYPASKRAVDCLYLLGSEYTTLGIYDSAADAYDRLMSEYPQSELADDSHWRLGWVEYRRGCFDEAEKAFGDFISANPDSPLVAQAVYWRARSLENTGDTLQAGMLYELLKAWYGLSYYSYLAESPGGVIVATDPATPPATVPAPAIRQYYDDPALDRSVELGVQGMYSYALRELKNAEPRYSGSVNALETIAGAYAGLGNYKRPLELSSWVYRSRMDSGRTPVPEGALKLMFPLAFWAVISRESERFSVDPFLVASLAREESHFDPQAMSPAGAVGLMQLMPATAAPVCQLLGMEDPTTGRLTREAFNVPIGVCHLEFLLEKHGGRLAYVLAEYNAGPAPLARWIAASPDAPDDEFVETITYAETRNYVKRVLRNYNVYRNLYGK